MLKRLKRAGREFTKSEPGKRFLEVHENLKCHGAASIIMVVLGCVLVVAGVVLGLVPGIPGVVLGCAGLALIATRFRKLAVWLDSAELRCRRLATRLRHPFVPKVKASKP